MHTMRIRLSSHRKQRCTLVQTEQLSSLVAHPKKKALPIKPFVVSSQPNSVLMGRIATDMAARSTEQTTATSADSPTSIFHSSLLPPPGELLETCRPDEASWAVDTSAWLSVAAEHRKSEGDALEDGSASERAAFRKLTGLVKATAMGTCTAALVHLMATCHSSAHLCTKRTRISGPHVRRRAAGGLRRGWGDGSWHSTVFVFFPVCHSKATKRAAVDAFLWRKHLETGSSFPASQHAVLQRCPPIQVCAHLPAHTSSSLALSGATNKLPRVYDGLVNGCGKGAGCRRAL